MSPIITPARSRRLWLELGCAAVALLLPWAVPSHAMMINEIAITALFALSLDLILGYTGIVSLGHAAFFGLGAYGAALFAKHVYPDPVVGLLFAMMLSALLGLLCSATVLRGSDLTRLMVTLGVAMILLELANKLDDLTGGADGLQGVIMGPVLGRFEFDLQGQTSAWYSLVVALIGFAWARRVVASPLGGSWMAIRDNRLRAMAVGIPVSSRIVTVYTLA
ncbi:MAG: branched-chain amino acid ABC transporter permease, partial [Limnohabitans sp.]|nr:branched-chain amino acid ABC transporter permease [Limnohabitans sp.]